MESGGCLRVLTTVITEKKIEELEMGANKDIRKIKVAHTLRYDKISEKYFILIDFEDLSFDRKENEKKGIKHKFQYRNEKLLYC